MSAFLLPPSPAHSVLSYKNAPDSPPLRGGRPRELHSVILQNEATTGLPRKAGEMSRNARQRGQAWAPIFCLSFILFSSRLDSSTLLNQAAPIRLGDGRAGMTRDPEAVSPLKLQGREWVGHFELKQASEVDVRIKRLRGLNRGDKTRAGISLDDQWLGFFRDVENGKAWSSAWIKLAAGSHEIRIQAGEIGEADFDDFVFEGLKVSDKLPELDVLLRQPEPVRRPRASFCPGLKVISLKQVMPRPRIVSITSGRESDTGLRLKLGYKQAYELEAKLGKIRVGETERHPPLLLSWSRPSSSRAKVLLHLDEKQMASQGQQGAAWQPKDYQPDAFNRVDLWSCEAGKAWFRFAENPPILFEFSGASLTFELAIQGIEITLKAP